MNEDEFIYIFGKINLNHFYQKDLMKEENENKIKEDDEMIIGMIEDEI